MTVLSRGLRERLAANQREADSGEFRASLLEALGDPQVQDAVTRIVTTRLARQNKTAAARKPAGGRFRG